MRIVELVAELPRVPCGFVPTMGAFHDGHLQLMRRARQEHETVVVSLFVNPTQFRPGEDFEKYPRNLQRDADLAASVGVDVLFAPGVEEVYPRPSSTIHVPVVTDRWEGAARPGHFDGVATVVAKLFNMVQPSTAYFGLKDLQQCMVIERMVDDLNMAVKVSFEPTVREPDGLAMSSRNVYLSEEDRSRAPLIYATLVKCKEAVESGSRTAIELQDARNDLEDNGFRVDYLELVSLPDMQPITSLGGRNAVIVAAQLGTTRLIDNVLL